MPAQWGQIANEIVFYRIQQQFSKLQVCFDRFKPVLQVVFVYFGDAFSLIQVQLIFFIWTSSHSSIAQLFILEWFVTIFTQVLLIWNGIYVMEILVDSEFLWTLFNGDN